jgi:outer membrane protein assembly factor BamB
MTVEQHRLRLWPGIVLVALQWLIRFIVPIFAPDAVGLALIGGTVGGIAVLVWWIFFSRAPWSDRIGATILMAVAMLGTLRIVHESIATGAQGMLLPILAIPGLALALVASAAIGRRLSEPSRRAAMAAAILAACGLWALVRTGGFTGNFDNDLNWRWAKTPEERLLEAGGARRPAGAPAAPSLPAPPKPAPAKVAAPVAEASVSPRPTRTAAAKISEWPGFRGPRRDGTVPGVSIETDWSSSPPVRLWHRPVGPGWSSFAVQGDLFYTQEQRGPDEVVACYSVGTGEPVWAHRDAARFWESNAGAGPRSTPTLGNGRVYTFGATGIVNVLNANDGSVVWSRNAAADTDTTVPGWGFASSPLLFDDIVIIAASGRLVGYDAATGAPRWFGPAGRTSYSSPHLVTTGGVPQILLLSGTGATSVEPATGKVLWQHEWPGSTIVQPAITSDGDVLISTGDASGGIGVRRLAVAPGNGGWKIQERWTSRGLKPYFNDFVVHKGHAFGFDGSILSCIDLQDGTRKWKGGRYGHGQLILLPDQDLLLVLSEEGELALVRATPDAWTEAAKFPALEGKTWNHPALVRDILLARNGEEMAAFRLPRRKLP